MSKITRDIPVETLKAWGLPYGYDWEEVKAEILDTTAEGSGRWESYHSVVFVAPDDGKTYSVGYSEGLTEYQDQRPWEDEGENVTCTLVEKTTRTVEITEWKPVWQKAQKVPTKAELTAQWAQNREDREEFIEW